MGFWIAVGVLSSLSALAAEPAPPCDPGGAARQARRQYLDKSAKATVQERQQMVEQLVSRFPDVYEVQQ
jgi:hypothetical protein